MIPILRGSSWELTSQNVLNPLLEKVFSYSGMSDLDDLQNRRLLGYCRLTVVIVQAIKETYCPQEQCNAQSIDGLVTPSLEN